MVTSWCRSKTLQVRAVASRILHLAHGLLHLTRGPGSLTHLLASSRSRTDFWDDATGEPIHKCEDVPRYCPDTKTLKDMKTMSIWAEGVEGDVQLFVKSVSGYGCAAETA